MTEVSQAKNILSQKLAYDSTKNVTVTGYCPPIPVNLPVDKRLSVITPAERLMGLIFYCLY